jgi:hypothetical protein
VCFIGARKYVRAPKNIALPTDVAIDGTFGIGQIHNRFGIEVELKKLDAGHGQRRGARMAGWKAVAAHQSARSTW